jgi:hypothetical protein
MRYMKAQLESLIWIHEAIKRTLPLVKKYNLQVYLVIPAQENQQNRFWKNLEFNT